MITGDLPHGCAKAGCADRGGSAPFQVEQPFASSIVASDVVDSKSMAALNKSAATLRIFGDALDPDEISRLLSCAPTKAHVKGQIRYKTTLFKTGGWLLKASNQEPADLDAQVAELFSRVNTDLALWSELSQKFEIDLFCGFFMDETDEGMEVSAGTMKLLSERGIKLGFCVYAPTRDIAPGEPCPCGSGKTYAQCCAPKDGV